MSDDLNELYQQVILDHSRKPRNFHVLPEANRSAEGNNPLCGDRFTVFLKLEDGVIRDISFQGSGCAISKASASMMTDELKGKTVAEAEKLFSQYQHMVMIGPVDEEAMGKVASLFRRAAVSHARKMRHITLARHDGGIEGRGGGDDGGEIDA